LITSRKLLNIKVIQAPQRTEVSAANLQ